MNDKDYQFEVRNRRHAQGYAPKPPEPIGPCWRAPDLTEEEVQERNKLIDSGALPF